MPEREDPRLPVLFGPPELAGPQDAVLLDAGQPAPQGVALVLRLPAGSPAPPGFAHPNACACCVPRAALAQLLGGLFLARARGETVLFRRLVVAIAEPAELRLALAEDRLVAGRYRLEPQG